MFFQSQAFLTEKSQKKPHLVWLFLFPKKTKGVQKSQNFKIWLQKIQIGNPAQQKMFLMYPEKALSSHTR